MPVVMIPIDFDKSSNEDSTRRSFVIRPFITSDFMTGVAAVPGLHLPENVLLEMAHQIERLPNTSRVLLDMTSKPPGTTEWE